MVKEVVLRRERHELREVAFARSVGMAMRVWMVGVGGKRVARNHAGVGAERVNQGSDGMLRSFFAKR